MAVNLINSNDIEVEQTGNDIQLKTSTPLSTIEGNIGNLSLLNTTDKSSLVNAINENVTKIGNMRSTILWTNNNPTSNFPSSGETGTISLSTDDYDFIIWVCSDNNAFTSPAGNFIYFKGQNYMNFSNAIGSSGTQIFNIFRFLQRVDDKTFKISRCFKYKQSGNNTSLTYEDKTLLPMYAIGFKTGLFS